SGLYQLDVDVVADSGELRLDVGNVSRQVVEAHGVPAAVHVGEGQAGVDLGVAGVEIVVVLLAAEAGERAVVVRQVIQRQHGEFPDFLARPKVHIGLAAVGAWGGLAQARTEVLIAVGQDPVGVSVEQDLGRGADDWGGHERLSRTMSSAGFIGCAGACRSSDLPRARYRWRSGQSVCTWLYSAAQPQAGWVWRSRQ